jgi:hypothetical protein
MSKKNYPAEEIIIKLREVEVLCGKDVFMAAQEVKKGRTFAFASN